MPVQSAEERSRRARSQGSEAQIFTVTDGNTLLATEEISMVVVLRMYRNWMKFMRQNYPKLAKRTVISTADDDTEEPDGDY